MKQENEVVATEINAALVYELKSRYVKAGRVIEFSDSSNTSSGLVTKVERIAGRPGKLQLLARENSGIIHYFGRFIAEVFIPDMTSSKIFREGDLDYRRYDWMLRRAGL